MKTTNRRYSDDNRHYGPFTLSKHTGRNDRPFGIVLDSGAYHSSERRTGCHLKMHGFGYTLISELPQIIADHRVKHIAGWDAATVERMGRNYYYEYFPKEFGFTFAGSALHLYFGPQTWDSTTTKSKCYFLPWKNWRHVRFSLYDLDGKLFWNEGEKERFEVRWAVQAACPTVSFEFDDYDGKRIQATTRIEEREWRFGEKAFKWLSLFRKPRIQRSLNIDFSEEVGPEKGSWKGGTVGHSIDMLPGELHEDAFRRYCQQDHRSKYRTFHITYVGKVVPVRDTQGQAAATT